MISAWRIVREKRAESAFSGEGAAKAGGRWNSKGRFVVYCSGSKALATLEILVHLNPPFLFSYKAFRVEFDEALVEHLPSEKLPLGWKAQPPPPAAQAIGDKWVETGSSAVLELPSAIVPEENNYLLNPRHGDFKHIRIGPPVEFTLDPRLLA
jgi:RES domain-containing protein